MNHRPARKKRKQRPRPDRGTGGYPLGDNAAKLDAALTAVALGKPCLLCGGPPDYACLWRPNDQQRFGAPASKERFFVYVLCLSCAGRPDVGEAVEEVLFAEAGDPSRN